ncbi:uncharacterized protein LOC124843598 [Vigna umbellata]|nr:uncharacterized protein LOC124843598 [Vigna umbellata]
MLRPSPYQLLLKNSPCFSLCFSASSAQIQTSQFFIISYSNSSFRNLSLLHNHFPPFRISTMSNCTVSSSNRTTAFDRFYTPPLFRKLHPDHRKKFNSDSVQPDLQTASYEPALSPTACLSNMDRLLDAFTPSVPAHSFREPKMKGRRTGYSSTNNSSGRLYIVLEDLWESYREWSAYGVEVPVSHDGEEEAKIYYAPSLSAIQLYAQG